MSLVFVGGVHGVGKSSACKHASQNSLFKHLIVSNLIKTAHKELLANNTKKVIDAEANQRAFLNVLATEKQKYPDLLIDGHFTLVNKSDEIELISESVFEEIDPDCFVVIHDDPHSLHARLKSRDGLALDVETLGKLQNSELEHAKYISQRLGKKLYIVSAKESEQELQKIVSSNGNVSQKR